MSSDTGTLARLSMSLPGDLFRQLDAMVEERGLPSRSQLIAELIRHAKLFIGADSGPLHLSSAVGVPSVALFGPKDPAVYGPYSRRHRVVFKPNGNGLGSMQAISVQDAFEAVKALL